MIKTPLLLVAIAAPTFAQSVHVVDDDGGAGVDFTDIQPAIDAAAAGDTLLVKPGTYSTFTLSKSLYVTAETDLTANVGAYVVTGLPADGEIVLRGLEVDPSELTATRIEANAGWIALEDCRFTRGPLVAGEALTVQDSVAVSLVRCTADGSVGEAVRTVDSGLYLYECTLTGGLSVPFGDDALLVDGGFVFIQGSLLVGTDGLDALLDCSLPGGDGGNGLTSTGAGAQVFLQSTTLVAGTGGAPGPLCPGGADGTPAAVAPGDALSDFGGAVHTLDVETPERMGNLATNLLVGEPGDIAVLGIGLDPAAVFFPPWFGTLGATNLVIVQVLGVVPPSGSFTVDLLVPTLGAFESFQFFEQAAFVSTSGVLTLSSPCYPLALSPAF